MRHNPQRRTALLDAAIDVLAREGMRGLTLRAVDAEAGVPVGTCSNYFTHRGQLLGQIMRRTRERLTPDPAELADTLTAPRDHHLVARLLRQVHQRTDTDRAGYLAMLELRLEGARRPELGAELDKALAAELETTVRFHLDAGLPGDRTDVVLLHLAVHGMIVDDLTVPAVLDGHAPALIDELTTRLLGPARPATA